MLLASAPLSTRARWLGVSTLVLAMALAAPSAVHAQDGTVYIGGGSNSQDGARGVQGGDNVIVNMDAIDGGRGRAGSRSRSGGGMDGNRPNVEFGEPYRGPAGAILRFPPERPPQSQLVVDPEQIPDRRQARRDSQPVDPTPARKPEQRRDAPQQQDRQRTMAATPAAKPDTPSRSQSRARSASDESATADLPEAPRFDDPGSADGESRTARRTEPAAATGTADGGAAPTELTVRPTRKPEPPQPTRTAERADAEPRETAAVPSDDTGTATPDTAETREPAQPSDPAGETSAEAPATASQPEPAPEPASDPDPQPTQTAETTVGSDAPAADDTGGSQDAAPADTQAGATQQQAATGSQPASDPTAEAPATDTATPEAPDEAAGDDATGDDATGDDATGETQTAALPPEALPDQMRLMFEDGSAGLSDGVKSRLDQLAELLEENPQQRVQLMAFAQGSEGTASQARRLSLSRALAVRTYLIDKGIRSTRMDVRALGATADQGPLDRVDIVPANR